MNAETEDFPCFEVAGLLSNRALLQAITCNNLLARGIETRSYKEKKTVRAMASATPTKVLFIGNSLTYFNNGLWTHVKVSDSAL